MSINPDNIRRVIRANKRAAWWSRNSIRFLIAFTAGAMIALVLLMATPR